MINLRLQDLPREFTAPTIPMVAATVEIATAIVKPGHSVPRISPMVQTLTTLVTTAAMLIHAAVGCCAHHGHVMTSGHHGCPHDTVAETNAEPIFDSLCDHSSDCQNSAHAKCGDQPEAPHEHRHIPCDDTSCDLLSSNPAAVGSHAGEHDVLQAAFPTGQSRQTGLRWAVSNGLAQTDGPLSEVTRALTQVWRL